MIEGKPPVPLVSSASSTIQEATNALTESNYRFLQQYVYRESGIVLGDNKQYLIESRLTPLVRETSLASLNALCEAVRRGDHQLSRRVVDSMTTNETLWFREPGHYDFLKQQVLPRLMASRQRSREIRVWSAASSSGQEIYSTAMMLVELGLGDWNLRLTGTDISEQILARARAGRYLQMEVNRGLPAAYVVKYFQRDGLDWILRERIRSLVRFERFDLRQSPTRLGSFDIVFCRNVLIYFDAETRLKILRGIRSVMPAGAVLLLSSAESVTSFDAGLERKTQGQVIFYEAK